MRHLYNVSPPTYRKITADIREYLTPLHITGFRSLAAHMILSFVKLRTPSDKLTDFCAERYPDKIHHDVFAVDVRGGISEAVVDFHAGVHLLKVGEAFQNFAGRGVDQNAI